MSLGNRIWRLARHRVRQSFGLEQGARFREESLPNGYVLLDPGAREELEEFLRQDSPAAPAEPRVPHPYQYEYRLLGAPVGSDLETVTRCWRQLVRETHPDRFAHDPAAQTRAADRLRRVNDAYERLKRYLQAD